MDQTRLNFLNLFFNFKKSSKISYIYYGEVNFDIEPEYILKMCGNNTYFKNKKLKRNIILVPRIKVKKVYNNKHINNILFF